MYICGYTDKYTNHIVNGELGVVSVGSNTVEVEKSEVIRPNGLPDFQWIYVEKGVLYVYEGEKEIIVPANHGILFFPNEPQHYIDCTKDHTHTYWLHFGGIKASSLLSDLGLLKKDLFFIKNDSIVKKILNSIIDELLQKRPYYNERAIAELINLLVEIKRSESENKNISQAQTIKKICKKMQTEYAKNISNQYYADECDMSLAYFIRSFKEVTGKSPQSYITYLRIEAAKGLLSSTQEPISTIARLVGYQDPLYFTRCFTKTEGISPKEYRNRSNY